MNTDSFIVEVHSGDCVKYFPDSTPGHFTYHLPVPFDTGPGKWLCALTAFECGGPPTEHASFYVFGNFREASVVNGAQLPLVSKVFLNNAKSIYMPRHPIYVPVKTGCHTNLTFNIIDRAGSQPSFIDKYSACTLHFKRGGTYYEIATLLS